MDCEVGVTFRTECNNLIQRCATSEGRVCVLKGFVSPLNLLRRDRIVFKRLDWTLVKEKEEEFTLEWAVGLYYTHFNQVDAAIPVI